MSVESTKVLFPRFQHEEMPEGQSNEIYKRKLVWNAELKPWLDSVQVQEILSPRAVTNVSRNYNAMGNWWGARHIAKETTVLPQDFEMPGGRGEFIYRSRIIRHDYLWDEQAVGGHAYEVILERRQATSLREGFYPDMALLMQPSSGWAMDTQRLVLSEPAGAERWVEPETDPGEINDALDFRLLVLSELATRVAAVEPVAIA